MALFKNVSVQVGNLGGGSFSLLVGPEGYTIDRDDIRQIVFAQRKELSFLLFQIALQLDAQGIDPRNVTPAQLKNAIEAMTLKW